MGTGVPQEDATPVRRSQIDAELLGGSIGVESEVGKGHGAGAGAVSDLSRNLMQQSLEDRAVRTR